MNIFEAYAPKYYESNYSVIPNYGKLPPKGFDDYQVFSDELPAEEIFENWCDKYKDANISLMLGKASGVIALDFDYEGSDYEQMENIVLGIIPPSPVEKRGRRGWTKFYKFNGEESTKKDRLAPGQEKPSRFFDLLSTSKYTVIPPSIHPDTRQPYKWCGDGLLEYSQEDLPSLPAECIVKLKELADMDLKSGEIPFQLKSGRHDKIMGYAFRIIEHVSSLDDLASKILEYDVLLHGEKNYFNDRKYFRGRKTALENAKDVAERFEKSAIRWRKKKFGIDWKIGQVKEKDRVLLEKHEYTSAYFYKIVSTDKGPKPVPTYREAAEFIMRDGSFVFSDSFGYKFNGKNWEWLENNAFNCFLANVNKDFWLPSHLDQFKKGIKALNDFSTKRFKENDGMMNLDNGIYDVNNQKLLPHSKEYFFKHSIPVEFNEKATCPTWNETLKYVFEGDEVLAKLIQQMFGYVLIGGYPFLHKAFVPYGEGRNGKSTVLDVLKKILGKGNFSSVSMANLNKPFSAMLLDGKLANIASETPPTGIDAEIFKAAVAGESITAAHKGMDEYDLEVKARFIFACNGLPVFGDNSVGMKDRLVLIPFNRYIGEKERDKTIRNRLMNELPGILNWAIVGAQSILEDRELVASDKVDSLKEEYMIETDSVFSFFKECVEFKKDNAVSSGDVYVNYIVYCEANGKRPFQKDKMIKAFKKYVHAMHNTNGLFFEKEFKFYQSDKLPQCRGFNNISVTTAGIKTKKQFENERSFYDS